MYISVYTAVERLVCSPQQTGLRLFHWTILEPLGSYEMKWEYKTKRKTLLT